MKKKQFMSKLAALTMAAMMGLSAVPASAINVLAKTTIETDTSVKQTAATVNTIDTTAGDGKNAVDAVKGKTGLDFSTVADDDTSAAKTIIGTISTTINGGPAGADTVTVDSFKAAKAAGGAAAENGTLSGSATWSVAGTPTTDVDGSYYDITITVPFTATWADTDKANVSLAVDDTKVTGTKTTFTNTKGEDPDNYDSETGKLDTDNLTTLQQQVKDAIEATDTTDDTAATKSKIKAAVEKVTHDTATVLSLTKNDGMLKGKLQILFPQGDDASVDNYEIFEFTTEKATARQKRVNAAADAVSKALTRDEDGNSEYSVDSENTIDKVIPTILSDKGYTDVNYESFTETVKTTTDYEGTFTVVIPATVNASGVQTAPEVKATRNFNLGTGSIAPKLTDTGYLSAFATAIGNAPMYDDTTADELTSYLNSEKFKPGGNTLKESKVTVSNVRINGITDVAHGKPGTADVTLTLKDASGTTLTKSYTISNVQHSDSTKLKEATDTVATVAAKVDTTKAQKKTATEALELGDDAKDGKEFAYNAAKVNNGTGSVEEIALKVVKDSLNTVINAKAASADKKLSADYITTAVGKQVDVTAKVDDKDWTEDGWTYDAAAKFVPTIKITDYTKATSAKEGSATVEVTFRTPNDDYALDDSTGASKIQSSTAKFTLTFGKLKEKASTFIELGGTQYMTLFTFTDEKDDDGKVINKKRSYTTRTLTAKTDGNDPISWTSSDPSVAIVDANGKVTAKGLGTATITATNANNASVSDSVAVVVKNNDEYKFVDVQNPNMFYFSPVYAAAADKVTSGTNDTHFSPDENVTRAQFITWLYKKAGSPAVTVTGQFTDVPADKWYTNAVYWALENGITAGTTPTTFAPDQTLTRGQAMMFLYKAYGKGKTYNRELALQFTDVAETSPFAEAINWGLNLGITHGYTTTKFGPDDTCTRGQAVTFLYNAD